MTVRRTMHMLTSTLLLASLLTACTTTRGSGNLATESRPIAGFTEVELAETGEAIIEQTGTESLTIEAEDNLLPMLTSRVVNSRLLLGIRNNTIVRPTQPITYRVTVKELSQITVSGSGTIHVPRIQGDKFTIVVSGSGNVRIAGQVTSQDVRISGSGTYSAEDLDCHTANVDIPGSGKAIVKVSQRLEAIVSGQGSIEYIGDPVVNSHISGSGQITKQ